MAKGKHDVLFNMIVNAAFLGRIWGITARRVQENAAQGIIPKKDRGRYVLGPACLAYSEYQRRCPAGTSFSLTDERTRLTRAQADNEEMKTAQLKAELLPADDVQLVWQRHISDCRARLLAIPSKLAPLLVALTELPEIKGVIELQVHEALDELKTINPRDYAKASVDDTDLETTPETNGRRVGRQKKKITRGKK